MSAARDTSADRITTGETFALIGRSLRFIWPYWPQILVKLILSFIGIAVILFLPWPLKFLIDYVVVGLPVTSSPTPIPHPPLPGLLATRGVRRRTCTKEDKAEVDEHDDHEGSRRLHGQTR